jgi:hypothetical protein
MTIMISVKRLRYRKGLGERGQKVNHIFLGLRNLGSAAIQDEKRLIEKPKEKRMVLKYDEKNPAPWVF